MQGLCNTRPTGNARWGLASPALLRPHSGLKVKMSMSIACDDHFRSAPLPKLSITRLNPAS